MLPLNLGGANQIPMSEIRTGKIPGTYHQTESYFLFVNAEVQNKAAFILHASSEPRRCKPDLDARNTAPTE